MKSRDNFETQDEFESYVEYMMGNPMDELGLPELVKVYWCSKSDGHWDDEGTCSSHYTGEYVWWPEDDVYDMPLSKEEAMEIARKDTGG